ncbi:MAG: hypothetical protein IJR49_05905, partial [Treponema sp.]|nr:hypothetical protein [Treponema sp.]
MIFHSAKKQHIKILIFVLVCVNFIFPPIFINFDETVFLHKWSFPLNSIIRALVVYALLLFIKKEDSVSLVKKMIQKEHRKDNIKYSFLTLIFLCAMSFCFSRFFASKSFFLRPKSFLEFIYCILTFLCSAFFEETIYRIYLP